MNIINNKTGKKKKYSVQDRGESSDAVWVRDIGPEEKIDLSWRRQRWRREGDLWELQGWRGSEMGRSVDGSCLEIKLEKPGM